MASDPMEFMRMGRPQIPSSPDIRPARADINGRSLADLATNPASPGYRSKLPPPPCHRCGEDHYPGRSYDHDWQPEPELPKPSNIPIYEQMTAANGFPPPSTGVSSPSTVLQRVAVYVGRNDTYVVAVESAPDWDSVAAFKVGADRLLDLVHLARALCVKVADKTGGDLVALEQEHAS